jgi:hypothetical protein
LGAAQYEETGRIALRVTPGGFSTAHGPRQLSVIGTQLVIADDTGTRDVPLTTVAAAATIIGITPGMPRSVYPPATPQAPNEPLHLDPDSATFLASWYQLGDAALRRLAGDTAADTEPTLWPEHFDVAITIDAINFGASPGDAQIELPYLYVGPPGGPPTRDTFWNADFGATRSIDDTPCVEAAVEFFRAGRDRLADSGA